MNEFNGEYLEDTNLQYEDTPTIFKLPTQSQNETVAVSNSFESILDKAKTIIYGDREKTYGNPGANCERIAKIWEVIFGHSVTSEQVCLAMCAVKLARLVNQINHEDSLIDLCGYAALMERIQKHV